jgi:hypothetical protein
LLAGVNYFYSGRIKKTVALYSQIYSIQEDRPEKAEHTHTAGGNSIHHPCFGYAANFASIWDNFPSCDRCHLQRVIPKDYPQDQLDNPSDGLFPAKKIEFASLVVACERSHLHLIAGTWKSKHAEAFMRSEGLKPAVIDSVKDHASVCIAYNKALSLN